jgi:hypothetical protein
LEKPGSKLGRADAKLLVVGLRCCTLELEPGEYLPETEAETGSTGRFIVSDLRCNRPVDRNDGLKLADCYITASHCSAAEQAPA